MANMDWIESVGGSLILLPEHSMHSWLGITGPDLEPTHYDRSCKVEGYIGDIVVDNVHALVLGDEPLRTTWISVGDKSGMLIRWRYADSEQTILKFAMTINMDFTDDQELVFSVTHSPLVLFDAAFPGTDVLRDEMLILNLTPGKYAIRTANFTPDPATAFVVHSFDFHSELEGASDT